VTGGSLFVSRNFGLLLLGQTTSQIGAQVSGVAIPLLAVLSLSATPFQVGLITASSTLAFTLIGLPAGAWLDRFRRRPILIASDVTRGILLATIPVAAALGALNITQLVVVSVLTGFARVFFDIGYQSYIGVGGRQGPGARRKLVDGEHPRVRSGHRPRSGRLAGHHGGGRQRGGSPSRRLRGLRHVPGSDPDRRDPDRSTDTPTAAARTGQGRADLRRRNPILRATAIASGASNFAFAIASAVAFIFMARALALSATAIGLITAAGYLTVMFAAAATPRLSRGLGSVRVIWLSLAATGPVTLLSPLAQPGWSVALLVVGAAVGNAGQIVYAVTNLSLRQRLCPDTMLSRVTATMRFLIMGTFPVGALLGGVLGEVVRLRGTLWVSGVIVTLAALPLYLAIRRTGDVDDLADGSAQLAMTG
jgi:MFS family permease